MRRRGRGWGGRWRRSIAMTVGGRLSCSTALRAARRCLGATYSVRRDVLCDCDVVAAPVSSRPASCCCCCCSGRVPCETASPLCFLVNWRLRRPDRCCCLPRHSSDVSAGNCRIIAVNCSSTHGRSGRSDRRFHVGAVYRRSPSSF